MSLSPEANALLHKLRAADAPRFATPERVAPRIAEDPAVRVARVYAATRDEGRRGLDETREPASADRRAEIAAEPPPEPAGRAERARHAAARGGDDAPAEPAAPEAWAFDQASLARASEPSAVGAEAWPLVFRAEGAAPGGVYFEPAGGGRAMIAPDTPGHLMLPAGLAGDRIAVLAARQGSLPGPPDVVVFAAQDGETRAGVRGQAVALGACAALVADLDRGVLVRVGYDGYAPEDVAALIFEAQEQSTPLMAIDDAGLRALVMQVEAGRVSLVQVDLRSGERLPVIEGLPEPSWVTGAFLPGGGLLALEMVHDLRPRFRVLRFDPGRPARTLLELDHPQPAAVPTFVKTGWIALVLALEPARFGARGATDVVALPVGGGARVKLTELGDVRGQLRRTNEGLLVEGGPALLRMSPASG